MPVNRPTRTPASEEPLQVASMNPDNMVAAGLMDDFDGLIRKVRFVPWDYNGNVDHDVLAVAVTIQPADGEGDEFTQHYSAGNLDHFVPSADGRTAAPIDRNAQGDFIDPDNAEGEYALRVGKKPGLANNTNWAQFIGAALEAGFPKDQLGAKCSCFEGTFAHFNRIPQRKRSGLVVQSTEGDSGNGGPRDILVITEIKDAPASSPKTSAGKGATKVAAKPAAAAAKPVATSAVGGAAGSDGDLDSTLAGIIVEALSAVAEDGLPKTKLAALALRGLPPAMKAKGTRRINEKDFLESREDFVFDADTGTLYGA